MPHSERLLYFLDLWPYFGVSAAAIIIGAYAVTLRVRWYLYTREMGGPFAGRGPRRFTSHAKVPWWVAYPFLVSALSIFGGILASKAILFHEYARFKALVENPNSGVCLWSNRGKIKLSDPHDIALFMQMVIQGETLLPLGRGDYTPPVDPIVGISFRGRDEIYSLGHGASESSEYRLMLGYQPGSDRGHVLRRFLSPPLAKWLESHRLSSR